MLLYYLIIIRIICILESNKTSYFTCGPENQLRCQSLVLYGANKAVSHS